MKYWTLCKFTVNYYYSLIRSAFMLKHASGKCKLSAYWLKVWRKYWSFHKYTTRINRLWWITYRCNKLPFEVTKLITKLYTKVESANGLVKIECRSYIYTILYLKKYTQYDIMFIKLYCLRARCRVPKSDASNYRSYCAKTNYIVLLTKQHALWLFWVRFLFVCTIHTLINDQVCDR